ncbi:hypothetical protein BO71DRAFT_380326 [Aspergillus ellipticus CBS 707.79]|uniref:Short-chain dehydrogenases/reductase n=1 Tax=Aspergillus ellipticus CBS 707.79 TaxID=1448320 RepID=A0A319DRT0_9EURO|nr:hypothetical protein BO71DRAFT_380326 [Aspergillus ellipticus CBS 707.79]
MVSLPQVLASNQRIASTLPPGLVAVFVGGTSGVGEYTVKAFARYAVRPRVYIIGRSQESADRIMQECQQLNPGATFDFLQADVSLLVTVDEVCRQLSQRVKTINLLFLTQGTMAFSKTTSEGLPLAFATATHSRLRFILNLLPLIQAASSLRRVVSVLAATCEGPIDLANLPAQGAPLQQWRNQMASIQSLLLAQVSQRAPEVSFVHTVPGIVRGGIMRDAETNVVLVALTKLLMPFLETPPGECGERHVFLATSAVYQGGGVGVPADGVGVGSATSGGLYSVDNKGEASTGPVKVLDGFRVDGTAEKVWEGVVRDMERITNKSGGN